MPPPPPPPKSAPQPEAAVTFTPSPSLHFITVFHFCCYYTCHWYCHVVMTAVNIIHITHIPFTHYPFINPFLTLTVGGQRDEGQRGRGAGRQRR